MPQDVKAHPAELADATAPADEMELAPAAAREQLEGWIPPLATDAEIRDALEKAFDYRGDITVTLKDGSRIEGYLFDRRPGPTLTDCRVRLFPKDRDEKVSVSYADVARLEFTGRDTAAGKSWETWVRKYNEKKAAGETDIRLEPEKLD
ncbi:MAG: hypothetical protein JWO31_1697 [Phycisphaerales bacterium]|nr:hypothetical protein [Phycisphaerales bacterium]